MKLYASLTSPFARKIRVALREWGLASRAEIVVVDPWATPAALLAVSPLSKVPALETDCGVMLMDSRLILDYLLAIADREPTGDRPSRWREARHAQLADGIIEAAVAIVIESRRPASLQSEDWKNRQLAAILRTLDVLEAELGEWAVDGDVGTAELTFGCALEYLDFRFASIDWRAGRPVLDAWLARFAQRPAMRETVPPR